MSYETWRAQEILDQMVDVWIRDGVLPDHLSTRWRVEQDVNNLVNTLDYEGLLKVDDDVDDQGDNHDRNEH